ncbi:hypothetical protein BC832DRAFT_562229 [Gaertneriomyces semiglobifer]|nr:hypothetical protein BC832DRAFT_562229 [Gaertneriomyces semiglobifer]
MCSVEEDGVPSEAPPAPMPRTRRRVPIAGLCHKCKSSPPVVDMKRVMYCKACFKDSVQYRFRGSLLRTHRAADGEKALIAFSGGPSSRLLLHVLAQFHNPGNEGVGKKPRKFSDVVVCHVDQSALLGDTDAPTAVEKIASAYGLEFIHVKLESVFENQDGSDPGLFMSEDVSDEDANAFYLRYHATSSLSSAERLRQCIDALGKMSAKEDMVRHLTQYALRMASRRAGCKVLFLGTNATRMAIDVLSLTSKGRGFALPNEVSLDTDWHDGLILLRPIRDILSKEVAAYNRFERLDCVVTRTLTTGLPAKASIDRLTEEFVLGLQKDFPMTVNTVIRTAGKIVTNADAAERRCPLCDGPVYPGSHEWGVKHTVSKLSTNEDGVVEMTRQLSSTSIKHDCCEAADECACNAVPGCSSDPTDAGVVNIALNLCYACQNYVRDARDTAAARSRKAQLQERDNNAAGLVLPAFVGNEARRSWMRAQVQDFLLDDEE